MKLCRVTGGVYVQPICEQVDFACQTDMVTWPLMTTDHSEMST